MKLFKRQSNTSTTEIPPELQPYYDGNSKGSFPRWQRWVALLLFILLLIALVFAGRFVWHKLHTHTSTTTPSTKSQVNQSPSKDNVPKSSGTPVKTPASNTTNSGSVQAPSGTLPNTGG